MNERIERRIELPASIEAAWTALIDPAWLNRWLADEVDLDPRPGGGARFRVGMSERNGWVEEVSPPAEGDGETARLVFWWTVDGEPASRVELELVAAEAGGSELRVTETRPLEILDVIGMPLPGRGTSHGPMLVAA